MNPSYSPNSVRASLGQTAQASYAPSVPLSVYRELAAELQATKAMVDSLSAQNQQLAHQNQLMRQEIYRVVQTTLQLGQYAGVASAAEADRSAVAVKPSAKPLEIRQALRGALGSRPTPPSAFQAPPESVMGKREPAGALVPKFFTEQSGEKRRYGLPGDLSLPKNISGLWLVLSIVLIIFTAFGAGFLIMRPLLSDR